MKALIWEGPQHVAVREIPSPAPANGEVVVQVEAAGICGSEIEGYLGRQGNRTPPLVMGHEFAGRVSALGEDVDPSWRDARVTVNPLLTCGTCSACRSGRRNACERRQLIGIARPGGFAAETAVPVGALHRLPDGIDARLAALTEPLANGVHAIRIGTRGARAEDIVIIGAGTIGLAVLQAALATGVGDVTVVEPHAGRRAQAERLGARASVPGIEALAPASSSLVVDAVGRQETRRAGIATTRAGGTFVAIGLHDDATEISFHDLIRREIAIQSSYAYTDDDFERALELIASGRAGIGTLEPVLPLSAGPAAFAELARGASDKIKVFISGSA